MIMQVVQCARTRACLADLDQRLTRHARLPLVREFQMSLAAC
jgi:hypothetical protein